MAGRAHAPFLNAEHAVEIARGKQRAVVELMDVPGPGADREQNPRRGQRDKDGMRAAHLPGQ